MNKSDKRSSIGAKKEVEVIISDETKSTNPTGTIKSGGSSGNCDDSISCVDKPKKQAANFESASKGADDASSSLYCWEACGEVLTSQSAALDSTGGAGLCTPYLPAAWLRRKR